MHATKADHPINAAAALPPPLAAGLMLRLSAMMFLQFFVWGAWYVTTSNYMNAAGIGGYIGWAYSVSPIAANAVANVAPSAATRRSHASANPSPAPTHPPFTAATTGLGISASPRVIGL